MPGTAEALTVRPPNESYMRLERGTMWRMSGVALRPGVVKQYTYLGWGPNSTQAYCTQVLLLRMINMNRALVPTTCIPHWIWRMHRMVLVELRNRK